MASQTVAKEPAPFKAVPWETMCIDEAQRLKNVNSKLFQVLINELTAKHRMLLTGTPIQNNIAELWALLHFVDPRHFSSRDDFLDDFGGKMSSEKVARLQDILRRYLLRREKADVAKSLPRKTEIIIDVELTVSQKQWYRAILEKNRKFLNKDIDRGSLPSLMNVMMQLRKCCNHPQLLLVASSTPQPLVLTRCGARYCACLAQTPIHHRWQSAAWRLRPCSV